MARIRCRSIVERHDDTFWDIEGLDERSHQKDEYRMEVNIICEE